MALQPKHFIRIRVPATTANIGAGFNCLGLAFKLYNYFEFTILKKGPTRFFIQGLQGFGELTLSRRNLVYRSLEHIARKTGVKIPPMEIKILINIPMAKGLGSSATAIVAGMMAANALSGKKKLSEEELLREIARMEGHPDNVTAAYFGGLTAVVQLDDDFVYKRYRPFSRLKAVLVIPDYILPTSEAQRVLPAMVPHKDAVSNLSRIPFIIDRLCSGDLEDLHQVCSDCLHHQYRKPLIKHYDAIVKQALKAGAKAVVLSGAGPSMAAFCIDEPEKIATAMSDILTRNNIHNSTIILSPDTQGSRIMTMK